MSTKAPPLKTIVEHGPTSRWRVRQLLIAVLTVLAFLGLIGIVLLFNLHYQTALQTIAGRATSGAIVLEGQTRQLMRSIDFVLNEARRLFPTLGNSTDLVRAEDRRRFITLAQGLPDTGNLTFINAEGIATIASHPHHLNRSHNNDPLYLLLRRDKRDFAIGPVEQGGAPQTQLLRVGSSIISPTGTFLGAIIATVDTEQFEKAVRGHGLSDKGIFLISDMDGHRALRLPLHPAIDWNIQDGGLLDLANQNTSGQPFRRLSPIDGVERMMDYRFISEYGLLIFAAEPFSEVFVNWWDRTKDSIVLLSITLVILGVLVNALFRGIRREEQMIRSLEETICERTKEAQHQARQALLANESKSKFLAAASHDIRQPLQAAGMFIEALSNRLQDSPHAIVIDKLRQSMDATHTLLTALLDVSTLEASQVKPTITQFPVGPLLVNLYDQTEPEALAKGLILRVVPTGAWIESDPVLLERMLRNLVLNALRYTDTGKVLLGCQKRGNFLKISVVDTGIGIPKDKHQCIFDDFTRLGDKGEGANRGLGLGLGVVRRMALILDHDLEVDSVIGKGSRFSVLVPLSQPTLAPRQSRIVTPPPALPKVGSSLAEPARLTDPVS